MKSLAVIMLLAVTVAGSADKVDPPTLVPVDVHSVTVALVDGLVQVEPMGSTTDNRTLIREIAALVSRAAPGNDHKCRDIGEIRFNLRNGDTIRVGLLPAHQEGFYDLRFYNLEGYSVWKVDREQLLGLLERAGISARDPAFPG